MKWEHFVVAHYFWLLTVLAEDWPDSFQIFLHFFFGGGGWCWGKVLVSSAEGCEFDPGWIQ
jgi:hypothetical protein